MNPLNALNHPPLNATHAAVIPAAGFDPASLFPKGSVITVLGQVQDWTLGWAGRISCTLRLSIGDIPLVGNRDTLLAVDNGTWVRATLMRRHGDGTMHLMRVVAAGARPDDAQLDSECAWVPTALYHRHESMRRLRALLSQLEPALQGIFMAVMVDRQVQRSFFWRPSAADHHCYPGGLFDHSVAAAEFAHRASCASEHARGLSTLASLLFDIGKVFDTQLRTDRPRTLPALRPHPMSARRLERALAAIAGWRPGLAHDLAALLGASGPDDDGANSSRMPSARTKVCQAVQTAWFAHTPQGDLPGPTQSSASNTLTAMESRPSPADALVAKPRFSIEWAACFLDREGCIHVAKQTYRTQRNPSHRLRVCITQNDSGVLEHFMNGMGIPACLTPVKPQAWHSQPVYTLNFEGKHALQLLALLLPHLIRKRAEAQVAFAFWFEGGIGRYPGKGGVPPEVMATRERLYRKLQTMKRDGSGSTVAD
jgi:hypothetical protein